MSDKPQIMVRHVEANGRSAIVAYRAETTDENVLDQIFGHRGFDFSPLHESVQQRIRAHYDRIDQPTIVDGGAHIGVASVWFALNYPKAEVIAIEPHSGNFGLLKRNTGSLKVQPVRAALGEAIARVRVVDVGQGNWGYQTERAEVMGPEDVMCFPLMEFIEPARTFLVKLDIEGAEEGVLRTAGRWLRHVPVIMLEVHAWIDRSVLDCLYKNRDVYQVGESLVSVA